MSNLRFKNSNANSWLLKSGPAFNSLAATGQIMGMCPSWTWKGLMTVSLRVSCGGNIGNMGPLLQVIQP